MCSGEVAGRWRARDGSGVRRGEDVGDCVGSDGGTRLGVRLDETRRLTVLCAVMLFPVGIPAAFRGWKGGIRFQSQDPSQLSHPLMHFGDEHRHQLRREQLF